MNAHVANIIAAYGMADGQEVKGGLNWYAAAADESARRLRLPLERAAGIVAALSPQTPWVRNIALAEAHVRGRFGKRIATTTARFETARDIFDGADPIVRLGGNKVRSFWQCLVNPRHPLAVCIDGHAYSIWTGVRVMTHAVPGISNGLYGMIAADYREAAGYLAILPSQLQAITWLAWRRVHDSRPAADWHNMDDKAF